jgi:hypothetical protein
VKWLVKEVLLSSNFQRVGATSNTHVGRDFERAAKLFFESTGVFLTPDFVALVGYKVKRNHKFDLGSENPPILVECKSYTWTAGGNSPSAKIRGLNDVIFAVRPGISEGQIPSTAILEALLNSTARRYGVSVGDMHNPSQIAEELIKEVMDSSFLSATQKTQYCDSLLPISTTASAAPAPQAEVPRGEVTERTSRSLSAMIEMTSLLLAVSTGLMTTFLAIPELKKMGGDFIDGKALGVIILPVGITTATILAFSVLIKHKRSQRRLEEDAVRRIASRFRFGRDRSQVAKKP